MCLWRVGGGGAQKKIIMQKLTTMENSVLTQKDE